MSKYIHCHECDSGSDDGSEIKHFKCCSKFVPSPDWKGAALYWEDFIIQRIWWLGAFSKGLADSSPNAAEQLLAVIGDPRLGWMADITATRKRFHLDDRP